MASMSKRSSCPIIFTKSSFFIGVSIISHLSTTLLNASALKTLQDNGDTTIRIKFVVAEDKPQKQIVGDLSSVLSERGIQIPESFILVDSTGGGKNFFSIDRTTGAITLIYKLDREVICKKRAENCTVEMMVAAGEKYLDVRIEIMDVNDNAPLFDVLAKYIDVREDVRVGEKIPLPIADDYDSPQYGVISYTLEKVSPLVNYERDSVVTDLEVIQKYFKLQFILEKRINPEFEVIHSLDREMVEQFSFKLVAKDKGGKSAKVIINIKVTDINDNKPVWKNEPYTRDVKECTQEKKIFTFHAEDLDDKSTPNGQIKYKISDHTPYLQKVCDMVRIVDDSLYLDSNFRMNAKGLKKLDIDVTAYDQAGLSSDTRVTLNIIDCNDNAPKISIANYSAKVPEETPGTYMLSRINVKDDDTGTNAEFTCNLNDVSLFELKVGYNKKGMDGSMTVYYEIETKPDAIFDREKQPRHAVTIICQDNGSPRLTSRKDFKVLVIDKNDKAPRFDFHDIRLNILENMPQNTLLDTIIAKDDDEGINAEIKYSIDENGDKFFSIDKFGKLRTLVSFDRETRDLYEFYIIASDQGTPSLNSSVKIRVKILDANDCAPTFEKNYEFQMVESMNSENKFIALGNLNATDADLGENKAITYIVNPRPTVDSTRRRVSNGRNHFDFSKLFNINRQTGQLNIHGIVDRERASLITVEILAIDGGSHPLTATSTVTVTVLDLNDNDPEFKFPNSTHRTINVSLDSVVGFVVGHLRATDPDEGENGTVTYAISGKGGAEQRFIVDPDGKITLKKSLDQYKGSRHEKLMIKAYDNGSPKRSTARMIDINYIPSSPGSGGRIVGGRKDLGHRSDSDNRFGEGDGGIFAGGSLTILYILAAVVFIVFLAVLVVLVFLYNKSRQEDDREGPISGWKYSKRHSKETRNIQHHFGSSGTDPATIDALVRDGTMVLKTKPGLESPNTAAVCVFNDQENSYTHLAMTSARAAAYGYIPASGASQVVSSHYATYNPYSPSANERRRIQKRRESHGGGIKDDVIIGGTGSGYETCLWNLMDNSNAKNSDMNNPIQRRDARNQRTLRRNNTSDTEGGRDINNGSTDNLSTEHGGKTINRAYLFQQQRPSCGNGSVLDEDDPFLPARCHQQKNPNESEPMNASHSYAFLDSYGCTSVADGNKAFSRTDDMGRDELFLKKGFEKPVSNLTNSKANFKSSPYVTSSFV